MDKQLKDIKKANISIDDKIGMVLSRNCDFASANGGMLSVNAFEKTTKEILFLLDVGSNEVKCCSCDYPIVRNDGNSDYCGNCGDDLE